MRSALSAAQPAHRSTPSFRLCGLALLLGACAAVPPAGMGTGAAQGGAAAAASGAASAVASTNPAPARAASMPAAASGPSGLAHPFVAGGPAPGASQASAPSANLRPFAEVIKDAKRTDGLFTVWQKDDRVWLELKPTDLDQPLFLSPKIKSGIGEDGFYGGLMGEAMAIEFRRVHNVLQLLQVNTDYAAQAGTPVARSVESAFSPSLLASTLVVSQPHPERKSVLIEANGLFVTDLLGTGMGLQRTYRQGYAFDPRNSAITAVRATDDLLVFEVLNHYATGSIAVAQPGTPPGVPLPTVPRTVPDPRSLFMTFHYSIGRLPNPVMAGRKSDARVGYFTTGISDFTDDNARSPRKRYANRWRLEKKDPAAPLSEPVKPITFWLDRDIPDKYRAPITAGVLEWNKAFEKIGFKDAIHVETQPADAVWDTLDLGRASIRWMTNARPSFGAIGPSHVDPRSGEILDADIGIESLSSRNLRAARAQVLGAPLFEGGADAASGAPPASATMRQLQRCDYGDAAAEQLDYALELGEARGELDPSSPDVETFVDAFLKDVTMHEVGHALGLRHNFRASRLYTQAQLDDPTYTAEHGIAASVMDYSAINLAAPDSAPDHRGTPFNTTIGPYDYWAIEYAYKPVAAEQEAQALQAIASRSAEPELAYGTDEDNFLGLDPEALQFDLGADVLAFGRKRVAIARELLARQETRQLPADQDYAVLRRSVTYALRDMARAAAVLTRQIGGVRTLRDHPGTGRDPLEPVPAADQRAVLDLLTTGFLSADSFHVSPELQRKLALDFDERTDAVFGGEPVASTDFSIGGLLIELQRGVVHTVLSDPVATRLLDSESKLPSGALRLSELYAKVDQAVWSELATGTDIAAPRRELQREYVNHIAGLLVRPASLSRADARSLTRAHAQNLLGRISTQLAVSAKAGSRASLSPDARAHLQDCADTLSVALTAKAIRAGA